MTHLVINRSNNFGDAMLQMRALKEYKERTGITLSFISNHYLHYVAAVHTDLFENVMFGDTNYVNSLAAGWASHGYGGIIEFRVDWGKACEVGLLRAWCEETLKFTPSTDRPYFLLDEDELITAKSQHDWIMETKGPFRKSVLINFESVSAYTRGFKVEDWNRLIDMFSKDVALFYTAPITWTYGNPFTPRPNLFVLPAYPMGETGALSTVVDMVFAVHSGIFMLATACNAKCIVEINFNEGGSPQLISPPAVGEKYCIDSNRTVNWDALQGLFKKYAL